MKWYEITIQPRSAFITPLKGDTLFGHFCWQAAHDPTLVDGGLDQQISQYGQKPFAVFSSAFIKGDSATWFLKRPDIPLRFFPAFAGMNKKERIRNAKEMKKRKWMQVTDSLEIDLAQDKFLNNAELLRFLKTNLDDNTRKQIEGYGINRVTSSVSHPHNSINRLTGTTGTGMFAPYSTQTAWYFPETLLVIFVLIDENATDINQITKGIRNIGQWGFGKDASTGMGRFDVMEYRQLTLPDFSRASAFYTLAPSVPEKKAFKHIFSLPFTRFGKHGATLATSGAPFKNPVIMVDEGAVFFPSDACADTLIKKRYTGTAVCRVSKIMPQTVVQGYAPVLPIQLG